MITMDIEHACGHHAEAEFDETNPDVEGAREQLRASFCPDCSDASQNQAQAIPVKSSQGQGQDQAFEIDYSCGHSVLTVIASTVDDVQKRRDWLASKVCPTCYRAGPTPEMEEATKGWPTLTGTPKMVVWAEKIRAEKVLRAKAKSPPDEKLLKAYRGVVDAAWWIDNRANRGDADDKLLQGAGLQGKGSRTADSGARKARSSSSEAA